MLEIKKFIVNPIQENTYLLYDETKECIIVDAGFYYGEEEDEVDYFIEKNGLKPVRLINTHCHFDHLMGIEYLRNRYNIGFDVHREDEFLIERAVEQAARFGFEMKPVAKADNYLVENDVVRFGNTDLNVIHVPGHSPGHVVLHAQNDKMLIVGDVLFYGSIGRTDLPGGDYNTLINGIKSKLLCLPEDIVVYCGHGPETTIGFEKSYNPFLT
ncbi:MAG: MBL fold metallo-hydrolase [Prolixibacteraceae bacterium]|nr:MBL fold metallo-hydrolase [Prolixibacteraceae bacterium]MBN2774727.1 MBL fold metallo-hydrolase [Prolixibacteraceae bacterium]